MPGQPPRAERPATPRPTAPARAFLASGRQVDFDLGGLADGVVDGAVLDDGAQAVAALLRQLGMPAIRSLMAAARVGRSALVLAWQSIRSRSVGRPWRRRNRSA
jgi:hypothetical protein